MNQNPARLCRKDVDLLLTLNPNEVLLEVVLTRLQALNQGPVTSHHSKLAETLVKEALTSLVNHRKHLGLP